MRLLFGLVTLLALALGLTSARAANFTLVYHHVGGGAGGTLGVTPGELRARVARLQALGYRFVTSSEVPGLPENARTVSLEFDDGFEEVYRLAFPVLRALGVRATVYPILDLIGQPGHMTAAQLAELRAAGWEVGSHTRSHADLTDLTPASLERELEPAAAALPGPPPCLAYPLSRFDARVRRVAAHWYGCAVRGAFGVGREDPFALHSALITPWDGQLLPLRAASGLDLRAPILLLGAGLVVLDRPAEVGQAPTLWNPAPYEWLGSGMYSLEWFGGRRSTRFAAREGAWVLSGIFDRRGFGPDGTRYDAVTLGRNLGPVTLAAGWGSEGMVLGAALALNGSGDLWARYSGHLAAGAELLPLDYARVRLAYDARAGFAGEASYALPWQGGEGRPLRVLGGYDGQWYLGSEYRMGSFAFSLKAAPTTPAFGIGFKSVW